MRNAEENRLQILFDEIPDADTRDALKSNGFRWSPRNKAWQRQLTQNAEYAARRAWPVNCAPDNNPKTKTPRRPGSPPGHCVV